MKGSDEESIAVQRSPRGKTKHPCLALRPSPNFRSAWQRPACKRAALRRPKKPVNHSLVLLRSLRACGVQEQATRPYSRRGAREDAQLLRSSEGDRLRRELPLQVRRAAPGATARTGRVNEHAVKQFRRRRRRRSGGTPCSDNVDAAAEPRAVRAHPQLLQRCIAHILRPDDAVERLQHDCQLQALAACASASVEPGAAGASRLRGKEQRLAGNVLDFERAEREAWQRRQVDGRGGVGDGKGAGDGRRAEGGAESGELAAQGGEEAPHMAAERASPRRQLLLLLQHVSTHDCQAAFFCSPMHERYLEATLEMTMSCLQGRILNSSSSLPSQASVPAGDSALILPLQRAALVILTALSKAWLPPAAEGGMAPPLQLREAFRSFLFSSALPALLLALSDPRNINARDANAQGVLAEAASLLWTVVSSYQAGEAELAVVQTAGAVWPAEACNRLAQLLGGARSAPLGTFRESFKQMIRSLSGVK